MLLKMDSKKNMGKNVNYKEVLKNMRTRWKLYT